MTPAEKSPSLQPQNLLSQQVSGSRYFFLGLQPGAGAFLALGGREYCNPDYAIDRSGYAYHIIEYVAAGQGSVTLDGRQHELGPGSVFSCAPTTSCAMRTSAENPMVKYFICLSGQRAPRLLARAGLAPGQVRRVVAHGEVRGVFEDLIREGRHAGSQTKEICELLVELLALKLAATVDEASAAGGLARENFLRCKALIDAQAERLVTLEDIAAAAGLDTSSICRLFRRFQGTSPYQYLLRRKMNLAAEYLVETGGLVKEAALRVGFADPYHFSRCFKAVHGVPPKSMQKHR
ncbi:MAG: AraC family transcriptional regulator [Nibricoccus sp.]